MSNQQDQQTYLLRLWQSDDGSWRILLQDSAEERPEGFTNISDLCMHLKALTEKTSPTTNSHRFSVDNGQVPGDSPHNTVEQDLH